MIDPAIDPASDPAIGAASECSDRAGRGLPLMRTNDVLRIDCHSCIARPLDCADCVVSFMLGGPPSDVADLDPTETAALAVLADSGLVPPLRLVTDRPAPVPDRS